MMYISITRKKIVRYMHRISYLRCFGILLVIAICSVLYIMEFKLPTNNSNILLNNIIKRVGESQITLGSRVLLNNFSTTTHHTHESNTYETQTRVFPNYTSPNETLESVMNIFKDNFEEIERHRKEFLETSKVPNGTFINPELQMGHYNVYTVGPGYFNELKAYDGIRTVNFSASLDVIISFWPHMFHKQIANKEFSYRKSGLPLSFDKGLRTENSFEGHSPDHATLQTTNVNNENPSSDILLTFIHIIKNGIIFTDGIVAHSNIHLNQKACKYKSYNKSQSHELPIHDEVFTISEFWGGGFFHSTVENIPRLATYVDFLRRYSSILIHCRAEKSFTVNFVRELGLNNTIVTGHVKAKIIYMPAGVACGRATTFPSLMLNLRLRSNVEMPTAERNSVILIKRSSRRWFDHHDDIWKMLAKHQAHYGYKLELFSDRMTPSFKKTMQMFNRAIMVVGPHGAGLSNIFFSQPGTVVVEGLCQELNMCYSRLAYVLGDLYYGVIPKDDCRNTTAEMIEKAIIPYFEWLKATKQLQGHIIHP